MFVEGQLNEEACGQQSVFVDSNNVKDNIKNKQRGQLVLEYLLLMMFAVAIASLIKTQFIGGDSDDPQSAGVMTKLLYNVVRPIASDTPSE